MMKQALNLVPHVPWTLVGMLIFLVLFIVMSIRTARIREDDIKRLAALPFKDGSGEQNE